MKKGYFIKCMMWCAVLALVFIALKSTINTGYENQRLSQGFYKSK